MKLSPFIELLFKEGRVVLEGGLAFITEEDIKETLTILKTYYQEDIMEMPFSPPAFSEDAAIWAAQYFYTAVQLTVLRDEEEQTIREKLLPFAGSISSDVIYSADLTLRYLPSLSELAKGLAPADILVQELRKTAEQWPFSSVGIDLEETWNEEMIYTAPSLKYEYIDRIVQVKDKKRALKPLTALYVHEVTGEYLQTFWPGLETVIK